MKPFGQWFADFGKPVPVMERMLTPEAEAEGDAFYRDYGSGNCSCHLGRAPCGSCTHPGNPMNQAEDETAWMMVPAEGGAS